MNERIRVLALQAGFQYIKDRLAHLIAYVQETEARSVQHESDRQLIARFEQDRAVRLKYPAVEKAYQKYVTMLELCRH